MSVPPLNNREVNAHCRLGNAALLEQAIERLGFSTRAYRRLDRPLNPAWE